MLCIKFVNYRDKYTEMHGQQNVKICLFIFHSPIHTRTRASLHNSWFYVPISIIPPQLLLMDATIISPFPALFTSPLWRQNIILTIDFSKSHATRVINLARFYITGLWSRQINLPSVRRSRTCTGRRYVNSTRYVFPIMWLAGSNRTKMLLGSQLYLATQHPLFARPLSLTGKFTVYKKDVLFELKCGSERILKGMFTVKFY